MMDEQVADLMGLVVSNLLERVKALEDRESSRATAHEQVGDLSRRLKLLEERDGLWATIMTQQLAALDALKAAVCGLLNNGAGSELLHASVDAHFASFRAIILKGQPHPVYLGHFETERAVLQLELQPEQAALHAVPDVKH